MKLEVKKICAELEEQRGIDAFITGGAQGAAQVSFWSVEELKQEGRDIRNIVYIPFQDQDCIWNENSMFGKTEYKEILSKADEIKNCELDNLNRIENMVHRTEAMIDASACVVCVWNKAWSPLDADQRNETANAVRYARSKDKPIYVLDLSAKDRYWLF